MKNMNKYTGNIRINDEYYDSNKMKIVKGFEVQMQRVSDLNWERIEIDSDYVDAQATAYNLSKQFPHPIVYGVDGYGIQF